MRIYNLVYNQNNQVSTQVLFTRYRTCTVALVHSFKSLCVLHSKAELLLQLVVAWIGGKVNAVEAVVRAYGREKVV